MADLLKMEISYYLYHLLKYLFSLFLRKLASCVQSIEKLSAFAEAKYLIGYS